MATRSCSFVLCATLLIAACANRVYAAGHVSNLTENDKTILNFALNLEYLEAEFYSWAAYGMGLPEDLTGGDAPTIGGKKALLSPSLQALAQEIADDEVAHVRLLRSVLGEDAVAKPVIDIGPAFEAAAEAALQLTYNVTELPVAFDPYASDILFLHGAFIFEDVGVTAYRGAAPSIDNANYLSAAAGILAVEAYHAGAVRTLLTNVAHDVVFPYGITVAQIIELRDFVQEGDTDQGLLFNPETGMAPEFSVVELDTPFNKTFEVEVLSATTTNVVPTDADGLVFPRGVEEVLKIVYLGASSCGGFFPECINMPPMAAANDSSLAG